MSKEKIDELQFEDENLDKNLRQRNIALDLLDFLDQSPSMYHSTLASARKFEDAGFEQLKLSDNWDLKVNGKYYLVVNNSTIIAFVVGTQKDAGFRIVGAHTDSPTFKIKENPVIKKNGYIQLNTEIYGGPIVKTWFDRPLSIAGRVFLRGEESHKPEVKLLNIDYELLTIPSLAIHMTNLDERDKSPNPQKHLLPIIGLGDEFDLDEMIADELEVDKKDILSYDLFLYDTQYANFVGKNMEFFQSGKIDNLGMLHAGVSALLNAKESKNTQIFVGFDNEEIGSSTQQGAASAMFRDVLKKISFAMGNDEISFINQIYKSYMISADQVHAIHPNYIEKADPTNQPEINKGPVIKDSARKSYATDGFGRAVLESIAQKHNIPLQYFHNRSDMRGGSTIGAIIETNTGIRNIDIGNPMLAMHSVREMAGIKDQVYMIDLMKAFFEE